MKQFVLKAPTVLLILLVLSPLLISKLLLGGIFPALQSENIELFTGILQVTTIALWHLSILDYFCSEKNDNRNKKLIQVIITVSFAFSLGLVFLNPTLSYLVYMLLAIGLLVFMLKKIKAVFYERSDWFIVLELILVPVGIYTLTEEIKNSESEKQSLEKE